MMQIKHSVPESRWSRFSVLDRRWGAIFEVYVGSHGHVQVLLTNDDFNLNVLSSRHIDMGKDVVIWTSNTTNMGSRVELGPAHDR
jgi:hypothetical protein